MTVSVKLGHDRYKELMNEFLLDPSVKVVVPFKAWLRAKFNVPVQTTLVKTYGATNMLTSQRIDYFFVLPDDEQAIEFKLRHL